MASEEPCRQSTHIGDNRFYGFTANSFTSVSLDPALISFCLNVKSASFDAFFSTKYFAINILSNYCCICVAEIKGYGVFPCNTLEYCDAGYKTGAKK